LTKRYLPPLLIATTVVALDVVSKRYAASHFADSDVVVIPGFLGFTYVENPGAAFSLFQNAGQLLGVLAIGVTLFVLWALRLERPTVETAAFGLIIGGAIGNLIDRMIRGDGFLDGKVVDWVDLWWIPTFNVADSAVTFAVSLLLIQAWRNRETS
jgi:signal peptidase II